MHLHPAVDGHTRLACTEALEDEKARTAIGFLNRAKTFFAADCIARIERIVTDNGACYRARDFAHVLQGARHQHITPYTPRHNGKAERYNRILSEEFLYARESTSEGHRAEVLEVWDVHYNYHRPHTAVGNQLPAPGLVSPTQWPHKANHQCCYSARLAQHRAAARYPTCGTTDAAGVHG